MQDNLERLRQHEPFFDIWWLKDETPIGRGNSGVVYRINDGRMDAALKVISLPKSEEQLRQLFDTYGNAEYVNAVIDREYQYAVQEIEIMRKLKGLSNVVCFEDSKIFSRSDTHGWDIIIRMEELIQLDEKMKNSMKRDQVMKMWSDLVTGLFYCERSGIVHLDIKPDNIFYTGANMNLYKLGDFGVAIRTDNGKVKEGIMQGSPAYMSPEIYRGQGGDIRSDIYSLAIVVYELLNNNILPFMTKGGSSEELDTTIRRRCTPGQEIPPIKSLDPRLSRILMRCLRYSPSERYQTVQDLHQELQQYMLGGKGPKHYNLLIKVLAGVGIMSVVGAALLIVLNQPAFRDALTFVGTSGVVDTNDRTIVVNAQTIGTAELRLRGSAKSQITFRIVDQADDSVRTERALTLDENGEQTAWSFDEETLEDGKYNFIAWYTDQAENKEVYEANVDTIAPQTPQIISDMPYAGAVDWPLTVSADPGSTVQLLVNGVETDSHSIDEGGITIFMGTYTLENHYSLVSRDAAGNPSSITSFSPVQKQTRAALSDVDEDASELIIEAESGASIALAVNGEAVDNSLIQYVEGERYRYTPAYGFKAGDSYILTVTDRYGLQGTAQIVVAESARAPITLSIVNADAQSIVRDQDIQVTGTAENGDTVYLTWNGSRVGGEIPVLDGQYTGYLSRQDAGVEGDSATGAIGVVYRYGAASRASATVNVQWQPGEASAEAETVDYRPIDIVALPELDQNDAGAWIVAGNTDAGFEIGLFNGARGQRVEYELTRDGEAIRSGEIDMSSTSGAATLDIGAAGLEDGEYRLSVHYKDAPEVGEWRHALVVDRMPPELVYEGSMPHANVEWTMQLLTEPEAILTLRDADDAVLWTEVADEDGAATLAYRFEEDIEYALTAEDNYGNVSEPIILTAIDYRAIDIVATPELAQDDAGRWIIVGGTDAELEIGLFNGARDQTVEYELKRDGEEVQSGTVVMSKTSGAATLELDMADLDDGIYQLSVRYQSAEDAGSWQQSFLVDRTPPEIELDGTMPYADVDWVLTVHTEKDARVELRDANDIVVWNGEADGKGVATLTYRFEEGVEYALTAEDGYGNVSAPLDVTASRKEVVARLSDVYEDSEALLVETDPDTEEFALYHNGVMLDIDALVPEVDEARNAFRYVPESGRFIAGDVYTLEVTDTYGLKNVNEKAVQEAVRVPIVLTVDNVFKPDGVVYDRELTFTLTGQAGAQVELLWNGRVIGKPWVPGDDNTIEGSLSLEDVDLDAAGGSGVLSAQYASGYATSMAFDGVDVVWTPDDSVTLDIQPVREDSDALVIDSDADALIEITPIVDGERGDTVHIEDVGDGSVAWTPEGGRFYQGQVFAIHATDHIGNEQEKQVTVGQSTRTAVTLTVANSFDWAANGLSPYYRDADTVIDAVLSVQGTGEPGQRVNVNWLDRQVAEAVVSSDGRYSCTVEWSSDDDVTMQSGTLSVDYADGRTPSLTDEVELVWMPDDGVVLNEDDGGLQLYWGSAITVRTDPWATVTVRFGGDTYDLGSADETGTLTWKADFDYEIGTPYTIMVTDIFGHMRTTQTMRVEEIQRAAIEAQLADVTQFSNGELVVTEDRLRISGTAQADEALTVEINGQTKPITTNAYGQFALILDDPEEGGIHSGDTVNLSIRYSDGASASRTLTMEPFVWDWTVDYTLNVPVTEDTQRLELSATEPVTAMLFYNPYNPLGSDGFFENYWGIVEASEDQSASWALDSEIASWQRGDSGRVIVEDRWGNVDYTQFSVGKTALADPEGGIVTGGAILDGMPVVTQSVLSVSGSAEPGETLDIALYAEPGGQLATAQVTVDSQGGFSVDFDADALGGYSDKATYYAVVGYPRSVARVSMQTEAVRWDYVGPDVTIENEGTVDATWRAIRGATEPGARVVLVIDGVRLEQQAAGGSFEFSRSELMGIADDVVGKTMSIVAYDDAGNSGSPWEITFERASYPASMVITNQEPDGSVSSQMQIEGWFAGFDRMDAQIILRSSEGKLMGSARPNYESMTGEEKASLLGDQAAGYGDLCYRFNATYDLSNIPAGDCELVLMFSDFITEEQLVAVPATVIKSAADSNTLVVGDGMAMDIDPVTHSYPSDGIVLTGWICQSENAADTSSIDAVQINSVSGAVNSQTIDFEYDDEHSDSPQAVLEKAGYAFVERDIALAADASVMDGVSNPTNRKAGFILNLGSLDQPLPDGEYTLTVTASGGETYQQLVIGPLRITIDNNAAKMSASELNGLMEEWRPVVVEEVLKDEAQEE